MLALTAHLSALALTLTLGLSACTPFPQREPPPSLHDFGFRWNQGVRGDAAWSSVVVDAPEWLQDDRIRYRLLYAEPTRVRFYTRDRWLAAPPSLLVQRLATAARGGDGYRLHIQLLEFEQVFDTSQRSRVILQLRAKAYQSETNRSAEERLFQLTRLAPAANAIGAVTAFAELIDETINSLETWLAELPSRPEPVSLEKL